MKGCAVACSLRSLNRKLGTKYKTSDHAAFEPAAGVPRQIAYLQDYIFENLPAPKHTEWPERFWAAIQPGADLSMVTPRFVRWVLEDTLPLVKTAETQSIYKRIIRLYDRWIQGNKPSDTEWRKVCYAAADAAAAAAALYADAAAALCGCRMRRCRRRRTLRRRRRRLRRRRRRRRRTLRRRRLRRRTLRRRRRTLRRCGAARYAGADAADAARYAGAAAADAALYAAADAALYAVLEKQADKLIELLSTAPVLSSANQPESADEQYAGGKPK